MLRSKKHNNKKIRRGEKKDEYKSRTRIGIA